MASKTFANKVLGAEKTLISLYTTSSDILTTSFISLINTQNKTVKVRLAVGKDSSAGNKDYIEYDAEILANATLTHDGMILSPKETIWVYSDNKDLVARVDGIETNIGKVNLE